MSELSLSVEELLNNLGGSENIQKFDGCSTRITFSLNDLEKLNLESLKNNNNIISVIEYGNDVIIVLGNKTEEFLKDLNQSKLSSQIEKSEKKQNIGQKLLGVLAGVFAPALTILSATGMIKGFLALFVFLNIVSEDSGTYTILYAIGDSFFYFMPIFLGASAAKFFGCDRFLGIAIGASLVYPTITALADQDAISVLFKGSIFESEVYTSFMNIPVILPTGGYVSTVIPVILSVFCASLIWKLWDKVIPEVVKGFLVPTLTLVIVVPLTFIVVGPIAIILSNILGAIASFLYNLSPALEGAFIGGFWQIMVMFGLHWAVIPIMMLNLSQNGFDSFLQGFFPACFAQAAACLAIFLKTKNQSLKDLCIPAFISGMFGITEPALYGVTLPRIKIFVFTCIASALAGAVIGLMNVKVFMFGGMGIFGFPSYINPETGDISNIYGALIGSIINFVLAFLFTYFLYKDNTEINAEEFPK